MGARTEIITSGAYAVQDRRARSRSARTRLFSAVSGERSIFLLFALHVPLGVLMYEFSVLSILHPLVVVVLGMYLAVQQKEPIWRVACVVGYLVGAEVLWRMAGAPIFWEFGKYGSVAIMVVALIRRGLVHVPSLPLLYVILLIPACYVTFAVNNWQNARDRLSFNMSGPICLFVSCWFFSQVKLDDTRLKKLLLSLAVPLVSVAVATLFFTVTNPYLQFTTESNEMTSGGFGPNQVSAMLGLGVFISTSALLLFKNDMRTAILLGVLSLLFTAQSVLTFSRGGIYAAIGALAVLALFQAQSFAHFVRRFLPVAAIAAVFMLVIFPNLNDFTGGKLEERFESSDTTNRLSIMGMELQVFMDNPVVGVGVGEAIDERYQMSHHFAASHTELTRLLSEHGSLGVLAILSLVAATIYNLRRQTSRIGKAIVAGSIVWSGLFMMNAGMRLAAPAFIWGLSFVLVVDSVFKARRLVAKPGRRNQTAPRVRRKRLSFSPSE